LPEPGSDVVNVPPDAVAVAAWKASQVVPEPSQIVNSCPFCACTVAPFLKLWDAEKVRMFDPDVMLTVPAPATRSRIVLAAMVCSPYLPDPTLGRIAVGEEVGLHVRRVRPRRGRRPEVPGAVRPHLEAVAPLQEVVD